MATTFTPVPAQSLVRGDVVWDPDKFGIIGYHDFSHPLESNLIVLKVDDYGKMYGEPRLSISFGTWDGAQTRIAWAPDRDVVKMTKGA